MGIASLLDPGRPADDALACELALARAVVGYGVRDLFVGTGDLRSIHGFLPPAVGGGGKLSGNVDGALDILVSTGERGILPGNGALGCGGPGGYP